MTKCDSNYEVSSDNLTIIEDYEVKAFFNKDSGKNNYHIKNNISKKYLMVDDIEFYVLEMLDRNYGVSDINIGVYEKFHTIQVGKVDRFIKNLRNNGFFVNCDSNSKLTKFKQSIFQIRISFSKSNGLFEMLYKYIGHIFFKRNFLIACSIISILGMLCFFSQPQPEIKFNNYALELSLIYIGILVPIFLHEAFHAMTLINFNRKVDDAGIMLYMFIPVLYVNTSDSWMLDKKERILVSAAGPLCDFIIGSWFAIINLLLVDPTYKFISNQIAFFTYARIFLNLNPLLKWDGYYILMDIMDSGNLKEESVKFIKNNCRDIIMFRRKMNRREWNLIIYGVLSTVYVSYFLINILSNKGIANIKLVLNNGFSELNMGMMIGFVISASIFVTIIKLITELLIKTIRRR